MRKAVHSQELLWKAPRGAHGSEKVTATALRVPKGVGIVLALAISCTSWLLQGWDGALWVHGVTHGPPPRTPLAPGLARALLAGRATLPFSSSARAEPQQPDRGSANSG